MKVFVFIMTMVVAVGSLTVAVFKTQYAKVSQLALDEERYMRMIAEEKFEEQKSVVNGLQNDVSRLESKLKSSEALAKQTKAVNENLKQQLQQVEQAKNSLESQVKDLKSKTASRPPIAVSAGEI